LDSVSNFYAIFMEIFSFPGLVNHFGNGHYTNIMALFLSKYNHIKTFFVLNTIYSMGL
jgi:hypothetical protein